MNKFSDITFGINFTDIESKPNSPVVVEVFIDLACPFSGKIFLTLVKLREDFKKNNIKCIIHHVPQPWHPQSTYLNEAALAVKLIKPNIYIDYCLAVWEARPALFSDEATLNKTRGQIYDELAGLAEALGADKAAVRSKLELTEGGTHMTKDIKLITKFHRKRGIHVTPTVLVNGIEATQIESSFTYEQWKEFLAI
mmetsp:Transcript_16252/g.22902  ORF Transcript_16252/g.22902 Transcript_16252/m.22902 type:complete len:196 (+) Transcript_16252:3-590(+)